jgi:hypothetical protein
MRMLAPAFGLLLVSLAGCSRPQPEPTRVGPDDNFIAEQEQSLNRAVAEEASENDAEAASEINRPVDNAR